MKSRVISSKIWVSLSLLLSILGSSFIAQSQNATITFTSSGTFTVPAGVTSITLECWGGGGAGGGSESIYSGNSAGGGGGGGGYSKITNYHVIPGNTYSITVGVGGTGSTGNDGGDGGDSYFGSNICLATGGKGGEANDGAGGNGGSGDYSGGSGAAANFGIGGGGGSSAGPGASGNNGSGTSGGVAVTGGGAGGEVSGHPGSVPGGGGGGASAWWWWGTPGGAGADGKVIISFSISPCTALYWAGENSGISEGTSGNDFNSAANWSMDPDNYVTIGIAPGPCNAVYIHLQLTSGAPNTTITFSNDGTTIKSLDFSVKNVSANFGNGIFSGGLQLGNQSLTITGDIDLYSENNFMDKTVQLTMDCTDDNSLYVYGGTLTTNAVNNGGGAGECIVYPFSNPVGTTNKGKFILMGDASLQGVGDDAHPQLNKPSYLVFDGTGTQIITNNNSNGYPIYLGFNTVIGENHTPKVIFTGSNPNGFKSINNLTISNGSTAEIAATQSLDRNGSGTPGTFTLEPHANLVIKGNNFPTGYSTAYYLDATSTIEYSATNNNNQTIIDITYGNLTLSNSGTKIASGNLSIRGDILMNNNALFDGGAYNHEVEGDWINDASPNAYIYGNSTVTFNGSVPQNITGNFGSSFNALVIDNNAGITIGASSKVSIYESLTADGTGNTLNTNGNLILKSNANKTAWLGNMTGNIINGKATVERFISAHKGWRLISIPTSTTQTIKEAWQENAINSTENPSPGFGTQITSNLSNWLSAGFDRHSYAPSMKYYDAATNSWVGVASTNATQINNTRGYMVFVRGDRLSTGISSPVTTTNLRTKGEFKMGNRPVINVSPGSYATVGNPYASPVDFTHITRGSGLADVFYLWDPFLPGTYNVGGYQTFTAANGWAPVPGGTSAHPSGVSSTTIQSGEAFFVYAETGPGAHTLQFTESSKTGSNPPSFTRPSGQTDRGKRQFLRASLFNADGQLIDANAVAFDNEFKNKIDGFDAIKFGKRGGSLGIMRAGNILAVEARSHIAEEDTVFYRMSNLSGQDYILQIAPANMGSNALTAYLIDNYKKTSTVIPLSDTLSYSFAVNGDAASAASDRFMVVFSAQAILPVTFLYLTAEKRRNDVLLQWELGEEMNVLKYEVEKSADGNHFEAVAALNYDALKNGKYAWVDIQPLSGMNYYRIQSVTIDGKPERSRVVKVNNQPAAPAISLYPNPICGDKIHVRFRNQPKGIYNLIILNSAGQQILSKTTRVSGNSELLTIEWNNNLPHGIYTIMVSGSKNEKVVIPVKY